MHKTYEAEVKGKPGPKVLRNLEQGVMVDGRRTSPAQVRLLRSSDRSALLRITIHEGRKRQVRKMCAAVGHPVLSLCRTAYGRLQLGSLPVGKFSILQPADLAHIFSSSPHSDSAKKRKRQRQVRRL